MMSTASFIIIAFLLGAIFILVWVVKMMLRPRRSTLVSYQTKEEGHTLPKPQHSRMSKSQVPNNN